MLLSIRKDRFCSCFKENNLQAHSVLFPVRPQIA
uniref:Uncharacterized protein n=1 Tax=Anguilla anguilla TaxID=7936 RepID=A0A0E9TGJ7_ANGAN